MAQWLFKFLQRGTETLSPRRRRQVITVRALGGAFAACNAVVAFACLFGGAHWLGSCLLSLSGVYALPLFVAQASRRAVRMIPLVTGTLAVLGVSSAVGSESGAHICLFMLACWPFAIFDVDAELSSILSLLFLDGTIFIGVELSLLGGPEWQTSDAALANLVIRPILVTCSFVFFGAVLLNITKLNQNQEDHLLRQADDLRRANSAAKTALEARSQFLAMMSHEFRTPLNGIMGSSQVLATTDLSPEQSEQVELLKYSSEYMYCLVNDLFDHANSKRQRLELHLEPVNLAALCKLSLNARRLSAESKGLTVVAKLPERSPVVLGDGGRITQVLQELLNNAIKFTDRGTVTLELHLLVDEARQSVAATFTVSDTGKGMDSEVQARLFQEFQQGTQFDSRTADGIGLGLVKVQRIVDQMNGAIRVSSALSRGSNFTVQLDLTLAEQAASQTPSVRSFSSRESLESVVRGEVALSTSADQAPLHVHPSESPVSSSPQVDSGVTLKAQHPHLKVLVAEDNPVNQQILRKLLGKLGCVPTVVSDGALVVAAFQREPWDLILMDIQMPNMDGLEATREIRRLEARQSHIQIVAVTANANPEQVEAGMQAGLDDYLTKPVRLRGLADVLDRVSGRRESTQAAS